MHVYIYNAALYCRACGEALQNKLAAHDPRLIDAEDSDLFPQGPYPDGGGEADSPQHCDSCFTFLENPLTGEGYTYVREQAADQSSATDVIREWLDFYDME